MPTGLIRHDVGMVICVVEERTAMRARGNGNTGGYTQDEAA